MTCEFRAFAVKVLVWAMTQKCSLGLVLWSSLKVPLTDSEGANRYDLRQCQDNCIPLLFRRVGAKLTDFLRLFWGTLMVLAGKKCSSEKCHGAIKYCILQGR